MTAELPTLKDTAELLQVFDEVLEIPSGRVSLILNHPRPQTLVTRADAERVVKRHMMAEIAYDGARFDRAAVTGEVLVAAEPASVSAKTIGKLAAGTTFNVIPDTATISGTVRSYNPELRGRMELRLKELATGVATAMRPRPR